MGTASEDFEQFLQELNGLQPRLAGNDARMAARRAAAGMPPMAGATDPNPSGPIRGNAYLSGSYDIDPNTGGRVPMDLFSQEARPPGQHGETADPLARGIVAYGLGRGAGKYLIPEAGAAATPGARVMQRVAQ